MNDRWDHILTRGIAVGVAVFASRSLEAGDWGFAGFGYFLALSIVIRDAIKEAAA